MQARILKQSEEQKWTDFVKNHPESTIHQTPEWGHFQSTVPARGKYWIIVLEDTQPRLRGEVSPQSAPSQIIAGTVLIRHKLPKGYCWLYAARGPLLDYNRENNYECARSQMSALLIEIKKIAKNEKAIFLRIDPPLLAENLCHQGQDIPVCNLSSTKFSDNFHSREWNSQTGKFLAGNDLKFNDSRKQNPLTNSFSSDNSETTGKSFLKFPHFRQIESGFQPQHTLILDLTQSEEDILRQMKPKGRYNIHLAEKKGVKIIKSLPSDPDFTQNLTAFYKILKETTSRDGFHGHDQDFYKNMLKFLNSFSSYSPVSTPTPASASTSTSTSPHAALYLAQYNNQIIAGCLNTFFKDTATYYYGASGNTSRNVMAPYLLHWEAIKDAKAQGYKYYDFFGIAPKDAKNHPWSGVTEFKKKFGGQEVSYQKPQEFTFKKLPKLAYDIYKKLKKMV